MSSPQRTSMSAKLPKWTNGVAKQVRSSLSRGATPTRKPEAPTPRTTPTAAEINQGAAAAAGKKADAGKPSEEKEDGSDILPSNHLRRDRPSVHSVGGGPLIDLNEETHRRTALDLAALHLKEDGAGPTVPASLPMPAGGPGGNFGPKAPSARPFSASSMFSSMRKVITDRTSSQRSGSKDKGSRAGSKEDIPEENMPDFGELELPASALAHLPKSACRNSQRAFSTRDQTVLIIDWDDTLFPTTYVRTDLELSLRHPFKDQVLPDELMVEAQRLLTQCVASAEQVLRLANTLGRVIIVTLAKYPWVSNSCKFFYEGIGALMQSLGVKVVYAQQGEDIDHAAVKNMSDEESEVFWSEIKGRAIAREVKLFYSQYEGQSWKNVISIGDSDFERLGTKGAIENYVNEKGIVDSPSGDPSSPSAAGGYNSPGGKSGASSPGNKSTRSGTTISGEVNGHFFKVRAKTFKMVDQPTVEELLVELEMVRKWLPMMVNLDEGFDCDISDLEDAQQIKAIECTLSGKTGYGLTSRQSSEEKAN